MREKSRVKFCFTNAFNRELMVSLIGLDPSTVTRKLVFHYDLTLVPKVYLGIRIT